MSANRAVAPLSLALPKGRLFDLSVEWLTRAGMKPVFGERRLVADVAGTSEAPGVRVLIVKNADLPTYVHHAIAGLGVCGDDVVYESGYELLKLMDLPFGGSRMCLAGYGETADLHGSGGALRVATKFPRFTRHHFHERGLPVEVVKLSGSVELAPVLGLCPYIVDIVETGKTLEAHDLVVIEELTRIGVHLVANPAYYKLHYREIDRLVEVLKEVLP